MVTQNLNSVAVDDYSLDAYPVPQGTYEVLQPDSYWLVSYLHIQLDFDIFRQFPSVSSALELAVTDTWKFANIFFAHLKHL